MRSQADDTHWAVNTCADAELGDPRRTQRVIALATALAQHPTAHRPEACGKGARRTAASRVFANDAIAPHDVRHRQSAATASRLCQAPWVLAVHETTASDWTGPPAPQGMEVWHRLVAKWLSHCSPPVGHR